MVPASTFAALPWFKRGRDAAYELVRGECTQPDGGQRWTARMGVAASFRLPGLQTIVVLQSAIDVQGVGDAGHEQPVARLTAYRGQLSQAVHDAAPFEVAQSAAAFTPRHHQRVTRVPVAPTSTRATITGRNPRHWRRTRAASVAFELPSPREMGYHRFSISCMKHFFCAKVGRTVPQSGRGSYSGPPP